MARVLVHNAASDNRTASTRARRLARHSGYEIRDTERPGDAFRLARHAARNGADVVVASGGDGTVNEVVRGVDAAGSLDEIPLGVVPCGTGNGFAHDIGITGVADGFERLDAGRVRALDLRTADGRPFLKTCVCGVPAAISAHTTPTIKRYFRRIAYGQGAVPLALDALQGGDTHSFPRLCVRIGSTTDPIWRGAAILILVGNSRRFPGIVTRQAPLEDGLVEVVAVRRPDVVQTPSRSEPMPSDLDPRLLVRARTDEMRVEAPEPTLFTIDGELVDREQLTVGVRPRAVSFHVGEGYQP